MRFESLHNLHYETRIKNKAILKLRSRLPTMSLSLFLIEVAEINFHAGRKKTSLQEPISGPKIKNPPLGSRKVDFYAFSA